MIELRHLRGTDSPPTIAEPWVLVEKRDNRYFVSAKSKEVDPLAAGDTGIESDTNAIKSAQALAVLLGVKVIYWRDDQKPPERGGSPEESLSSPN
jgi:hypothetical protein